MAMFKNKGKQTKVVLDRVALMKIVDPLVQQRLSEIIDVSYQDFSETSYQGLYKDYLHELMSDDQKYNDLINKLKGERHE